MLRLAVVFEASDTVKCCFGAKSMIQILDRIDIRLAGQVRDPRVAHWYVLCARYANIPQFGT